MPVSLQQTDINPPEGSSFQYHHHTGLCTTSGQDDSEVDHFYQQLQATIDQTPKKTCSLYKGIGMLKLGKMHRQTGERFVDPTAMSRQMREVSDF